MIPKLLIKRVLNLLTAIGYFAVAGIAITYFFINEKFEWIPETALELVREKELLERPDAKSCSECHEGIYKAWKESRHSVSWISKTYVEASENHSKEKCLACHIPESVTGEKPNPRLDRRDEGIYCVSCHFLNGKMNGPYDLVAPPHPIYRNQITCDPVFVAPVIRKHIKNGKELEWKIHVKIATCLVKKID